MPFPPILALEFGNVLFLLPNSSCPINAQRCVGPLRTLVLGPGGGSQPRPHPTRSSVSRDRQTQHRRGRAVQGARWEASWRRRGLVSVTQPPRSQGWCRVAAPLGAKPLHWGLWRCWPGCNPLPPASRLCLRATRTAGWSWSGTCSLSTNIARSAAAGDAAWAPPQTAPSPRWAPPGRAGQAHPTRSPNPLSQVPHQPHCLCPAGLRGPAASSTPRAAVPSLVPEARLGTGGSN